MGDIDTVRQEFQCGFYMRLRWAEPKLKRKSNEDVVDWRSMWHPRYYFINAVNIEETEHWKVHRGGEAFFHYHIKGTFKEEFEIGNFPFDYQDLCLHMASKCKVSEMIFVKETDKEKLDNIRIQNFYSSQEWSLCSHVLTESKKSEEAEGASPNDYPQYKIRMNAVRQYKFYIYNVFLVMLLITAMTFASFTVEADIPADRVQISLTLLLTSVAFKYYVQQFVPTVSYFTLIDKYILCCMVFQFFMTVHNMIGGLITNSKALLIFEWTSFGIAVLAFLVINVYFGHLSWTCIKKAEKSKTDDKAKYNKLNPRHEKETKKPAKVADEGQEKIDGDQVLMNKNTITEIENDNREENITDNGNAYVNMESGKEECNEGNSGQMDVSIHEKMAKDTEEKKGIFV